MECRCVPQLRAPRLGPRLGPSWPATVTAGMASATARISWASSRQSAGDSLSSRAADAQRSFCGHSRESAVEQGQGRQEAGGPPHLEQSCEDALH